MSIEGRYRTVAVFESRGVGSNFAHIAGKLEALQGDRKGQYSIGIDKRWRICFKWTDGDAFEVEIVDYH